MAFSLLEISCCVNMEGKVACLESLNCNWRYLIAADILVGILESAQAILLDAY